MFSGGFRTPDSPALRDHTPNPCVGKQLQRSEWSFPRRRGRFHRLDARLQRPDVSLQPPNASVQLLNVSLPSQDVSLPGPDVSFLFRDVSSQFADVSLQFPNACLLLLGGSLLFGEVRLLCLGGSLPCDGTSHPGLGVSVSRRNVEAMAQGTHSIVPLSNGRMVQPWRGAAYRCAPIQSHNSFVRARSSAVFSGVSSTAKSPASCTPSDSRIG